MGVVYKARQVRLDRPVALKMVLAGAHASSEMLSRFHIEAQAVAHLQHPGIVQIHEVGEHDGLPYFSLEFVPGGSLSQLIAGKPQPPREGASMVRELALAMHEAHQRGIIHRDLKPANVLLTADGRPKITDFGLAKRMEDDSGQTRSGAIMGTPSYMAPEQAWGQTHEIGPLTDLYALGAILYEMLTGRPPFQGATALETLELARTREPVPPTQLQPKVPADLETICLKCLQKEPGRRYADDAALAADLDRFLEGRPILARPVSAPERFVRWCRRNPKVAGLAASVLVLLVAVTAVSSTAAVRLGTLNDKLTKSNKAESLAREAAENNAIEATKARDKEAIARLKETEALRKETEALKKEREALEKSEKAVKAAFDQNKNALQSIRYMSILITRRLTQFPGSQPVREELTKTAADSLAQTMNAMEQLGAVVKDPQGEFVAARTLAGINQQAGRIMDELGRYKEAGEYFHRMDDLIEATAAAHPGRPESLALMIASKSTLGDFELNRLMDSATAIRHYEQALEFRRRALANDPNNDEAKRGVGNALGALARARLKVGDPARAIDCYQEEAEVRDSISPAMASKLPFRRERSGLEEKLGDLALSLGDVKAGREHYEQALRLREAIDADAPSEPQARRDVLLSTQKLGLLQMIHLGDSAAARSLFEKARGEFEDRLKADPLNAVARDDVARIHYFLGTACLRLGDREAAARHFDACLAIREAFAADPSVRMDTTDLMLARARAGRHEKASAMAAELIKEPPLDPLVAYNAACAYALCLGAVAGSEAPESQALARRYADEALRALRMALAKGWKGLVDLRTDPDLDPIRSDPGLAAIVEELRRSTRP
jgi:serine/threonine-protein kinase